VDASGGNDGNSGTSTSAAWRTIGKVNSFSGFRPGDQILLRRGQMWREQLNVPAGGASGNPLVFGAYGSGANPLLKGSTLVTGWTAAGATNKWRASLSAQPLQVFFNGVRGTIRGSLSSVSAGTQWSWSSGVLYVYSTSDPDSAYTGPGIEASVRPSARTSGLINCRGHDYVTIESIDATQSNSFGLYFKSPGNYLTARGCDVSHSLDGGIVAPSGSPSLTQITFENCISHHNNGGYLEGAPGVTTYHEGLTVENTDGFVVRGCEVYSNYMEGVNFKRGARNGVTEYCTLHDNALINHYLEGATNIQIRYNRIYDCSYNAGIEMGLETNDRYNDNIRIYNNLFWNNAGGVSFWSANVTAQTRNISIYNNTFYGEGEAIRWKSGATDNYSGTNYIRNNIFWQNGGGNAAIRDYTSGDQAIGRTTIAYNAFQQGGYSDTTGSNARIISNPYFANAGARDFHLQSGSPCIDVGASVGLTRDYDGRAVPQGSGPDLGAFEYGSGGGTTSYTLTVTATNGTVTRTPNQSSYAAGTSVTLQATPNSGYTFTGWSGALAGTANPATLVMNSNKSVTANFAVVSGGTYTLTVSATNGTVTKTPNQSSYAAGTSVSLQATPNSGYVFTGWSGALTGTANPATLVMDSNKSVTANFSPSGGGGTTKTVGNTTVLPGTTSLQIRRAVPYTMPEAGQLRSISIYHEAGSGQVLLGVYTDSSGKPGARVGVTAATTVSNTAGWQTVPLQSPVSVSAGQKIWLAWVFQNAVVIHATAGSPGRADSTGTWSGGMPTSFGSSTIGNYLYSIYANYTVGTSTPVNYTLTVSATNGTVTKTPNQTSYAAGTSVSLRATPNTGYAFTGWSGALTGTANPATIAMDSNKSVTANFSRSAGDTTTKTVGNTTVFPGSTSLQIRRAVPYVMPEDGHLKSISIHHEAGSGQVLLGVYADSSGKPGTRVGVTSATTVTNAAGWQTIPLQSPVPVYKGRTIWLAWVFQNAVVIHATAGTPGRADSAATWSGGMPGTFGSSALGNYIYSVYANYTPWDRTATVSMLSATAVEEQDQVQATAEQASDSMVVLNVRDGAARVNPASVTIEVNGDVAYTGNVDSCDTASGVCTRAKTRTGYMYTYQPKGTSGEQTTVVVKARDMAGKAMPEQMYLFDTRTSVFGGNQDVATEQADEPVMAFDRTGLGRSKSATVSNHNGDTWTVWQEGETGQRQIYISRLADRAETSDDTVQLTHGQGDHANPTLAVDGAGVLYAVWQEKVRANWQVVTSVSLDGKTWSAPKPVVEGDGNQVNPAIAASREPSGIVAVTWQDDRAGNQDVYMATSTDAFMTAEVSAVTSDEVDQTEPVITIDSEDAVFLRWQDAGNGSVAPVETPQK